MYCNLSKITSNNFYIKNSASINILLLLLLLTLYLTPTLHDYTQYRTDDVWFASFIYNDYVNNIRTDEVYGGTLSNGLGGTLLFGKLFTSFYGFLADTIFGWEKVNLYSISVLITLLAAITWIFIFKSFDVESVYCLAFPICFLLSKSLFAAAHSLRPEVFVLFFSSLALLAAIYHWYWLSCLTCFISIETHPIGVVSIFYLIPLLASNSHRNYLAIHFKSIALQVTASFIICLILYQHLHGDFLKTGLIELKQSYRPPLSQNFFIDHFFAQKLFQNIPDFLLIAFSIVIYIKSKEYRDRDNVLGYMIVGMILFSILINRSVSGAYAVLAEPIIISITFYIFLKIKKIPLLLLIVVAINTPKYAYAYYRNLSEVHYDSNKSYQTKLTNSIPNFDLPVVGPPYDYWTFLGKATYFVECGYMDNEKFNKKIKAAWLIDHLAKDAFNTNCINKENIDKNYSKSLISSFKYMENEIQIYKIIQNQ